MTRSLVLCALLAIAFLPAALAQEPTDPKPEGEKPHVDCPANETCTDKAAGGPRSTTAGAPGESCMDGVQGNETCDGDLYYMSGPSRGPADGSCDECRDVVTTSGPGNEVTEPIPPAEPKTVPVPSVLAALGIVGAAVLLTVFVGRR